MPTDLPARLQYLAEYRGGLIRMADVVVEHVVKHGTTTDKREAMRSLLRALAADNRLNEVPRNDT